MILPLPEFWWRSPSSSASFPYFADLQMFAAEDEGRTEDATGRRIDKARAEGQVAKSADITQVLSLLLGGLVILLTLPRFISMEMSMVRFYFENLATMELTHEVAGKQFLRIGLHLGMVLWPIILIEFVTSIGGNVIQFGWNFTWKPLMPKWNKIIPQPGKLIGRILIGKQVLFNLAKSVLKLFGVGWIAYGVMENRLTEVLATWNMDVFGSVSLIMNIAWEILWKICFFLAILAIADYLFNRHQWKDSLKMKKEEVKDERRMSEGDPEVKKAQRRRMMEMMRRRMMKEIPTADVVITNPTHFAVAIKYDTATMTAPTVVAKGEGYLALKIKEIARQNNVPIFEDKPLAQMLFRSVEVGQQVPPELYRATAEVLAWVYRQKRKAA